MRSRCGESRWGCSGSPRATASESVVEVRAREVPCERSEGESASVPSSSVRMEESIRTPAVVPYAHRTASPTGGCAALSKRLSLPLCSAGIRGDDVDGGCTASQARVAAGALSRSCLASAGLAPPPSRYSRTTRAAAARAPTAWGKTGTARRGRRAGPPRRRRSSRRGAPRRASAPVIVGADDDPVILVDDDARGARRATPRRTSRLQCRPSRRRRPARGARPPPRPQG